MIHIRDQKFWFWFYEKLFYSSLKWLQEHDREYLDIPEEVISLNNYRASLGHQYPHITGNIMIDCTIQIQIMPQQKFLKLLNVPLDHVFEYFRANINDS